ncbi:MAG: response regulator transcription factor [Acidobacteria bacterium]|nr:response regulator transcription factor [Acidobacteriota bacterium]
MTQLLLVDDDRDLCSLISDFLTSKGLSVEIAHDGPACLRAAGIRRFDLILLDVMMPGMDGFAVLAELRRVSDTPVIMLTARGEPADRIAGLRLGADDYLPKPFDPDELLARIQAILRRVTGITVRESSPVIDIAGVRLNPSARTVTCNDQPVDLTAAEYEILEQLMRAAGRPVSRDEISLRLYQREASPFDRSIDVHLSHIRRKLGESGSMIRTIRGAGYLFALNKAGEASE